MKLKDKTAVVTGASKGIGAAIALQLAQEGAAVAVNYASDQAGAERVVARITAAGGRAVAVGANVSLQEDIDRLFAEASDALGPIDILVNNAGIFDFAPLEKVTAEHFHRQFNLNVLGLLLVTQKALEYFRPGGGCVINISSVVGINPLPGASVYSATKGAVDAISKSLSKELGPRGIRVNSVNPGMVETEGFHTAGIANSPLHQQIASQTPLGRIAQPDDVAKVVAFFASDEAGWVTGQTLLVSGGLN